jgi:N-acyl-D-amino-acid deacylase
VRAYVMGDRGARNEAATPEDIAQMAAITEGGLRSGALGFSTSRTILHRAIDGEVVPGTYASRDELLGIAEGIKRAGHGVLEMAGDLNPAVDEFAWMCDASKISGLPVTFALLQSPIKAIPWQEQLSRTHEAVAQGAKVTAQISLRGTGVLMNWRSSVHPFLWRKSWKEIAAWPWDQQLAALKDPAFKARLLADPVEMEDTALQALAVMVMHGWMLQYVSDGPIDYEPTPDDSIAARATARGVEPAEIAYDAMMANDGQGFIYLPILNYMDGNLDFVHTLLNDSATVVSLSDGGAHCGVICDAASPTFMLTHWVRDRARGPRIPLELAVRRQTRDTAALYGLHDRGVLAPGYLADVNVIDFDKLALQAPYLAFDLPAGGRRLLQQARGYTATVKRGQVTFREGNHSGALPGQLIRGPQRLGA